MIGKIIHLLGITGLISLIVATAHAGELDPDFGMDGRVSIEIGTHGDRAQAIAIQADGKILLGGASTNGDSLAFSLVRLLADGRPDSSFNGDGSVLLDLGPGDDEILALGLTPDGHILAGGYMTNGRDRDFALLRFNADGSLDPGFGNQGRVVTSVGNSDDEITALMVENSGAVLVAGSAAGTNGRVIVLGRYLPDGRPDPGFSDQGVSLIGIGQDVLAQGLVIEANGRIVISGSYADGGTTRMVLAGFTPEGLLDPGFGRDGIAATLFTNTVSEGYGILQDTGGDLYVAGSVGVEGERAAALFRFTEDGLADTSFGKDGVLTTEITPEDDVLYSLVGNGTHLVASGFTTDNTSRDFLLLTYEQQGSKQAASPASSRSLTEEKTGQLHIGELQVTDSFNTYAFEPVADVEPVEPTVMTTSFGTGDSVSYGLAMQKDGKVVTVGTSGENGLTSAVVARFSVTDKVSVTPKSAVPFNVNVSTLEPNEITATGAFTGGNINPGLGTVTQRGVVFSIAPYPVCKTDCAGGVADGDSGGSGDGNGGSDDTTAPLIESFTGEVAADGTVSLLVTTDENATCRYDDSNVNYDLMTGEFDGAGTTNHTASIANQAQGTYTYYARCVDGAINESMGKSLTLTIASKNTLNRASTLLAGTAVRIGDFLVPEARAVDTAGTLTTDTTSTSSTTRYDTSFINKEGYTIDGAGSGLYSSILEQLTPDTRYYVRAYAIVDGTVYYGPQYEFETSTACFIATAAYGSILHPAVSVLRDFRDRYLKTNGPGRKFVAWYYKNSPPIADRIAASGAMRFVVRLVLLPLIAGSWMLLHPGLMSMVFWLACLSLILLRLRRRCVPTPLN